MAGGVGIERDLRRRERAEIEPRQVGDANIAFSASSCAVVRPVALQRDRRVYEIVKLDLAQQAVVDDDGMRGRAGGAGGSPPGCARRHRRARSTGVVLRRRIVRGRRIVGERAAHTPCGQQRHHWRGSGRERVHQIDGACGNDGRRATSSWMTLPLYRQRTQTD